MQVSQAERSVLVTVKPPIANIFWGARCTAGASIKRSKPRSSAPIGPSTRPSKASARTGNRIKRLFTIRQPLRPGCCPCCR